MATNDESWQDVIQNEDWQKLIQNGDWERLIQDEDWQKLIQDEDCQKAMQDAVCEDSNIIYLSTQSGLNFDFNFELDVSAPNVSIDERLNHDVFTTNHNSLSESKHDIELSSQLSLLFSLAIESLAGFVPLVGGSSSEPSDMSTENYTSIIARMKDR